MKEFKVNDYLTLKLERDKTNIYVKGKRFEQCKFLLLNLPVDDIESFDEIESIDDAEHVLNRSMEGRGRKKIPVSPETEFWGHCSNLHAWVESNYDTRLLHRNLAFPLLKELCNAGDPSALKVFKEEIARRFESGHLSVIKFLLNGNYLKMFTREELDVIFLASRENMRKNLYHAWENRDSPEKFALSLLKKLIDAGSSLAKELFTKMVVKRIPRESSLLKYLWKNNYLDHFTGAELLALLESLNMTTLDLSGCNITISPTLVDLHPSFHSLNSRDILLLKHPDSLSKSISLRILDASDNELSFLPEYLSSQFSLEELYMHYNRFEVFPEVIITLPSLKILKLDGNKISTLPKSIIQLKSLKKLHLYQNKLKSLPTSIGNLSSLEELDVSWNALTALPESLTQLTALKILDLRGNYLTHLPRTIGNLSSLEKLYLSHNLLQELPESIIQLKSLTILDVQNNELKNSSELRATLMSLERLEDLKLEHQEPHYHLPVIKMA